MTEVIELKAQTVSPARARRTTVSLVHALLLVVVFLLAIFVDRPASDWCRAHLQSPITRAVMSKVGILGGKAAWPAVAVGLLAFPNRWRILSAYLGTLVACTGVLHAIKFSLGRARPKLETLAANPWHFQPFSAGDFDGFPSGHAMTAFIIALFVGRFFPPLRWPILIYAALAAFTRIALLDHYPSDVVGGAALATIGFLLAQRVLSSQWFDPFFKVSHQAGPAAPPP